MSLSFGTAQTASLAAVIAVVLAPTALAAGPPNDGREQATAVSSLPARLSGTTAGATVESFEPGSSCGPRAGSLWYALTPSAKQRRVVVQLAARGHLDAVVDVFQARRSQLGAVTCDAS